MNETDHVIDFICGLKWDELPTDLRHQSKRCLLDALGALIAGAETPPAHIVAKIAESQLRGTEASILVKGSRVSASGAALANGFAVNALDIDDGYRLVKGHPGACVLPVLLTAAEIAPVCSGAEFLTALIIGYELGIRAGRIRHAEYQAYHASGSWGAVAGAAAAGRVLGLDADTLRHAMGAAEYHAPIAPMMKGIQTPSMGKDGIGWGAMVAMLCVSMARQGFTGIEPLFSDTPTPEWVDDLGRDWQIFQLYFKPYAACRWAQPAVDGALKIKKSQDLLPGDIRAIRIHSFDAACALSAHPPANTEEAQYNIAYPVAVALIDGQVGPRQVLPPRIFDQDIRDLMRKITTEARQDYENAFPAKTYAEVEIETNQGENFASGRIQPRWEPPDSLPGDEELQEKFHQLVNPVLGKRRGSALQQLIWKFEKQPDADVLIRMCGKDK